MDTGMLYTAHTKTKSRGWTLGCHTQLKDRRLDTEMLYTVNTAHTKTIGRCRLDTGKEYTAHTKTWLDVGHWNAVNIWIQNIS